jgi:hypothetical protein
MTEGSKTIVMNNLERAVSTDINRLQTFKDAALSELARWMCGVQELNTEAFPGYITDYNPGDLDPYQFSVVINGLMPYPLNGTTDLLITPGLAFMEDSSASTDQSPFRFVNSDGVVAAGTLSLTTSPSATRIDVVECQLTETTTEQSNRDIYDPVTGLFTPALIDKVKKGSLTFRIRTGTDGGGFPGVVTGWLPLAIVSVPAAATDWDDCTIWDVRPLLSASNKPPFINHLRDTNASTFWSTAAWDGAGKTELRCTGKVTVGLGPYNQSGVLGNHPTDALWVDLIDTDNWASGASFGANAPFFLWALTPFGLPGWRKYTGATVSPRRPSGVAGVMAVTNIGPTAQGIPGAGINLPLSTGLGSSTIVGVIVGCGMTDASADLQPFTADGDSVYPLSVPFFSPTATGGATGIVTTTYDLVDNVYHPATSRGVRLTISRSYSGAGFDRTSGTITWTAYLTDSITGENIAEIGRGGETINPLTSMRLDVDVPFPFNYAAVGSWRVTIEYIHQWSGGTTDPTTANETGRINKWKMTP